MKIRELRTPSADTSFDPGQYFCGLEFYELNEPVSEADRVGLANMIHYTTFLSLRHGAEPYEASLVPRSSTFYAAVEACFGHLEGWHELPRESDALPLRFLVPFLLHHYPPPEKKARTGRFGRLADWLKRR